MDLSMDEKQEEKLARLIRDSENFVMSERTLRRNYLEDHLEHRQRLYNTYYQSYAKSIPRIVIIYLVVMGIIILLDGFSGDYFELPSSVMIALLGTTTLNVLGLMYIVAHHLFPKVHSDTPNH